MATEFWEVHLLFTGKNDFYTFFTVIILLVTTFLFAEAYHSILIVCMEFEYGYLWH